MTVPDPHALYELDILRAVEEDCRLTNRRVARKLGVSLKLAHQLLTRMIGKGLLHVRVVHARRWDYFLTPQGIAEKTRLTLEFLEFSLRFYREARRRSARLCQGLASQGVRTVAFLGSGDVAEIVYLGVAESGLRLVHVFDGEGDGTFLGLPVEPVSRLGDPRVDAVVVCCYDPARPMREGFLPPGVVPHPRMHWVFAPVAAAGSVEEVAP
ncbi:MAG: winged helix-turn-helix transcriptional regulator [Lentisphaeria bacterium]|nr:winged helix-turn-helix transcriptional regulator [Lentisphaeria bacterium]